MSSLDDHSENTCKDVTRDMWHVSPGPGSSVLINLDDTVDVGLGGEGHVGIVGYIGMG